MRSSGRYSSFWRMFFILSSPAAFLTEIGFKNYAIVNTKNMMTHGWTINTFNFDQDGNLETENDRQFSFTDLISGGLFDNMFVAIYL
jgi:hypothetical protein